MPRTRIIDANEFDVLGTRLLELIRPDPAGPEREAVRHFLCNEFRVTISLDALKTQLSESVRQLADGLATWIPRMSAPSRTYVVDATAGSGKTQLALQLMLDANAAGQSCLYTCFNRSLADHIARLTPARCRQCSRCWAYRSTCW